MRRVVVLADAAEDLEAARRFYDSQQTGIGDYCVTSLLADIESLASAFDVARAIGGLLCCGQLYGSNWPIPEGRRDFLRQSR